MEQTAEEATAQATPPKSAEAAYFRDEQLVNYPKLDFWKQLCPHLSISDQPLANLEAPYTVPEAQSQRLLKQVVKEGYFQSEPVLDLKECQALVKAVQALIAAGVHPVFLGVYDEYWRLVNRLSGVLEPILGPGCFPLLDYWVWCISTGTSSKGWPPHRDLQFQRETNREDGRPQLLTVWVPLTDATTYNGCMYVLPTDKDVNLINGDVSPTVKNLQDVRALPAPAGSILAWNQYLLHWGSAASIWSETPRISFGIYWQSGDVEPYSPKKVDFSSGFDLNQRLAYCCSMLLSYDHFHQYSHDVLVFCLESFQRLPYYRHLVPASMAEVIP